MKEPFEITEMENAILKMHLLPASERASRASAFADEQELTRREALRVLDVLYDVDREFRHIELGLI